MARRAIVHQQLITYCPASKFSFVAAVGQENLADVNPTPLPEGSFAPTIVDLLRQRAAYRPHDRAFTFLVDGENEELNVTYAELDQRARAIGA